MTAIRGLPAKKSRWRSMNRQYKLPCWDLLPHAKNVAHSGLLLAAAGRYRPAIQRRRTASASSSITLVARGGI